MYLWRGGKVGNQKQSGQTSQAANRTIKRTIN